MTDKWKVEARSVPWVSFNALILMGKEYQLRSSGSVACGSQSINLFFEITHYTHTHTFNGPFSETTQVSRYQKSKANLDFTKARDSEWQWHQLGHMQVCTLLETDNRISTPPLSFLQVGWPSCHPTNSVKALKANALHENYNNKIDTE